MIKVADLERQVRHELLEMSRLGYYSAVWYISRLMLSTYQPLLEVEEYLILDRALIALGRFVEAVEKRQQPNDDLLQAAQEYYRNISNLTENGDYPAGLANLLIVFRSFLQEIVYPASPQGVAAERIFLPLVRHPSSGYIQRPGEVYRFAKIEVDESSVLAVTLSKIENSIRRIEQYILADTGSFSLEGMLQYASELS